MLSTKTGEKDELGCLTIALGFLFGLLFLSESHDISPLSGNGVFIGLVVGVEV